MVYYNLGLFKKKNSGVNLFIFLTKIMTAVYSSSMSLVEKKKQQWAKEREELARLGIPFKISSSQLNYLEDSSHHSGTNNNNNNNSRRKFQENSSSERRSSLPPLYKNQFNSNNFDSYTNTTNNNNNKLTNNICNEREGETSGYGSDSFPSPEKELKNFPKTNQTGYESSSSFRDDRPRWSDKGGKPSHQIITHHDPPNWVKRGLEVDGAIVVANSSSPSLSPEQRCDENEIMMMMRPNTGSTTISHHQTNNNKNYLRGQNIPIDAVELAEREKKRQQALEHQEAVRKQLEERERKRQEEKERKLREEREQELEIQRYKEQERLRKLQEEQNLKEKLDKDRKRKEAMAEAVKVAEENAKLEKINKLRSNNRQRISHDDDDDADNNKTMLDINEKKPSDEKVGLEVNNNCKKVDTNDEEPILTPLQNSSSSSSSMTFFLQPSSTLDGLHHQYALLIPSTTAIPINALIPNKTENSHRLLTPTRFRGANNQCDQSTQTDDQFLLEEDKISENNNKYRHHHQRRSQSVESRPKWGANRPPTRYQKQSEKDLLYQRRKLRQKRENIIISNNKSYDEKNSSDDSPISTPVINLRRSRKLMNNTGNKTRWGGPDVEREILPLEIDNNKNQLLYIKCCCGCRCPRHHHHHHQSSSSTSVEILKIEENYPNNTINNNNNNNRDLLNEQENVLNKLSNLHSNLKVEQEKWENLTPPHSSNY